MINITKNESNKILFNFSKKTAKLYFVFSLYNQSTDQNYTFSGVDVSTNALQWSEFLLIETGKTYENTLNTIVNLDNGFYNYSIYDADAHQITPLSGTVIEKGIIRVVGTDEKISSGELDDTGRTNRFLGEI